MYGLFSSKETKLLLVKKCISVFGICFFKQRTIGVVSTISPIEENRMIKIFTWMLLNNLIEIIGCCHVELVETVGHTRACILAGSV